MALTTDDLQAIRTMMREEIAASEVRMTGKIADTKTEIMTYIESHVEKKIHQIADGHVQLAEKMDRMQADIDEIKETVTAHDIIITSRYQAAK